MDAPFFLLDLQNGRVGVGGVGRLTCQFVAHLEPSGVSAVISSVKVEANA